MIRLRQVALVATDLDAVVSELCDAFSLTVAFRDPGVAEFGLHNALMVIGDQFLEVVSPTRPGTTAGRLVDKRGDGGYVAIFEVDDLDERVETLESHDVRIVWSGDLPDIRGRHLHPKDVGGTLVSIDQPDPPGSWAWAGPDWSSHDETDVVSGIAGIRISADDPDAMRARWEQLDLVEAVEFVETPAARPGGLDVVELSATDPSRAGESFPIGGVEFRLV